MGEGEGGGGDTVGTVPIRGSGGRAPAGRSPVGTAGVGGRCNGQRGESVGVPGGTPQAKRRLGSAAARAAGWQLVAVSGCGAAAAGAAAANADPSPPRAVFLRAGSAGKKLNIYITQRRNVGALLCPSFPGARAVRAPSVPDFRDQDLFINRHARAHLERHLASHRHLHNITFCLWAACP